MNLFFPLFCSVPRKHRFHLSHFSALHPQHQWVPEYSNYWHHIKLRSFQKMSFQVQNFLFCCCTYSSSPQFVLGTELGWFFFAILSYIMPRHSFKRMTRGASNFERNHDTEFLSPGASLTTNHRKAPAIADQEQVITDNKRIWHQVLYLRRRNSNWESGTLRDKTPVIVELFMNQTPTWELAGLF